MKKNQRSKISCYYPFKVAEIDVSLLSQLSSLAVLDLQNNAIQVPTYVGGTYYMYLSLCIHSLKGIVA